jgi:hypothetical protein
MSERDKEQASPARSAVSARNSKVRIDVDRHLASRKAVGELLDRRKKVFVCSQRFAEGGIQSARVLIGGEYYDVDGTQLAQLIDGLSPADLMLVPAREDL